MEIVNLFKISSGALKQNRGRTILTILGVVIGIASVVIVMSVGNGLEGYVMDQMDAFGTDYVEVEPKVPNVSKTSSANAIGVTQGVSLTSLKYKDAEDVAELRNVKSMYAAVMGQEIVRYQNEKATPLLWGVTVGYPEIDSADLEVGRFFTEEEDRSLARVVVLGRDVKEKLFSEREAVGERIKIGKNNFKVIGIYEERGSVSFMNMDNAIYVPLRTTQKIIMGIDHVTFIMAKMIDPDKEDETKEEATLVIRENHDLESDNPDKDDFAVNGSGEAKEILDVVFGGITLLLVALAAISLLVGGVGIMNIMYVSVTERTYEIGLRKAVGATRKNILWQFLLEAVVITFAGGVVGVILGIIMSWLISIIAVSQGIDFAFILSWQGIIIACVFSIGIGMLFGIYPARKAAAMNPIEALRQE